MGGFQDHVLPYLGEKPLFCGVAESALPPGLSLAARTLLPTSWMRVPKHTRRTDVDRQIALSSSGYVSARAGVIRAGLNTRQHPQWWLLVHLLTAICADQVCAVKCSNLRLGPVFWITSRPRLACSNHCNHVDCLSWEEKGALVFVEY